MLRCVQNGATPLISAASKSTQLEAKQLLHLITPGSASAAGGRSGAGSVADGAGGADSAAFVGADGKVDESKVRACVRSRIIRFRVSQLGLW